MVERDGKNVFYEKRRGCGSGAIKISAGVEIIDDWRKKADFLAERQGIQLTDRHVEILVKLREFYDKYGVIPSIRGFEELCGVRMREIMDLFNTSCMKVVAEMAGLPADDCF